MRSIGKPYYILLLLLAYASGQQTPTLCNDGNQGLCECGTDGINTYVFTPGDYKRCIHTFIPASNNKLPVLLTIGGYDQAMLYGSGGVTGYARDYGFAVFGVGSTGPFAGDGGFGLEFPANGIINPKNPTPCSASDSKDYVYLKGILDFIDGMSDKLDNTKVFVEGFSQSSMYAAYFTICFADRIAGMWQVCNVGLFIVCFFIVPGALPWQDTIVVLKEYVVRESVEFSNVLVYILNGLLPHRYYRVEVLWQRRTIHQLLLAFKDSALIRTIRSMVVTAAKNTSVKTAPGGQSTLARAKTK